MSNDWDGLCDKHHVRFFQEVATKWYCLRCMILQNERLQNEVRELHKGHGKRFGMGPCICEWCATEKRVDGLQIGESRNLPYPKPITINAPPVCGKCFRLHHRDVECRVRD